MGQHRGVWIAVLAAAAAAADGCESGSVEDKDDDARVLAFIDRSPTDGEWAFPVWA